jgi:DNA-binding CsgD family transcriptional regulator
MVDLLAHHSNLERLSTSFAQVLATPARRVPKRQSAQPQRRLKPSEVDTLVALYEAGASHRQLAARFGVHRETVLEHLKRRGVPGRPNRRKLSDEQVQAAARLYESGLSLAQVGETFGVNAQTIRTHLSRAGVPIRPRRGWPKT